MPGVKKGTTTKSDIQTKKAEPVATAPKGSEAAKSQSQTLSEGTVAAVQAKPAKVLAPGSSNTQLDSNIKGDLNGNENLPMPVEELIARRAFFLFLERGASHGQDVNDWLRAESEIKVLVGAK